MISIFKLAALRILAHVRPSSFILGRAFAQTPRIPQAPHVKMVVTAKIEKLAAQ